MRFLSDSNETYSSYHWKGRPACKAVQQRPDVSDEFLHLLSPSTVLSSSEAGYIPPTQKLKLTVSGKGWGGDVTGKGWH